MDFIAFAILLSVALISCGPLGPLAQKPVHKSNYSSNGIDSSNLFELMGEKIPDYNTLYFTDGQGYEFMNCASNKLLIALGGGPEWFGNRIGAIGDKSYGANFADWLLPLYNEYNIFVLEKFDWGRGSDPFWDIENRERYTVDNLVENYTGVIKEYLSQNDYETIIVAGFSEGGIIAPELYFHLKEFHISALISIGAGGLVSPDDISAARRHKTLDDALINRYTVTYHQYLAAYGHGNYAYSPDELRFKRTGKVFIPLIWWYSFHARRPFEFYKNINIPVLFIHGEKDTNVPVVSTRYVEKNLPDKPFTYVYYPDMAHYPDTIGELKRLRADIAAWLRAEGL